MYNEFSFKYISNFYRYIIQKKPWDFFEFFIIAFVLSLLPDAIVSLNLIAESDENQRSFYGDGGILLLCSGILCSYFAVLSDFNAKKDTQSERSKNRVIAIVFCIIYFLTGLQYYFCQLAFDRPWKFIVLICVFSLFLLCFTFLVSTYLHFRRKVKVVDIQNFIEERDRRKLENRASNTQQSIDGTEV